MNYLNVIVLFLACFDYCVAVPNKYCKMKDFYCPPVKHVLCKNSGLVQCGDGSKGIAKPKDILKALNSLRNHVAQGEGSADEQKSRPPASNMMRLYWDTELEQIAVAAAQLCENYTIGSETSEACFHTERFPTTCLSAEIKDGDFRAAVSKWDEAGARVQKQYGVVEFYWLFNDENNFTNWDNFATVAHARSYKVACYLSQTLFVCIFGPSKTNGLPIYWSGTPCTNCPYNTACQKASDYPQLCSRDDVENEDDDDGTADASDAEFESARGMFHGPVISLTFGALCLVNLIRQILIGLA